MKFVSWFNRTAAVACMALLWATLASAQTVTDLEIDHNSVLIRASDISTGNPSADEDTDESTLGSLGKQPATSSKRYTFDIGFGVPVAVGNSGKYQNYGINFQTGFGRNFNRYTGVKLQYDFNYLNVPQTSTSTSSSTPGDVVINSISIDPYVNLSPDSKVGFYLVGGVGYNWKKTQFTAATGTEICYPTQGCVLQSTVIASYPNDALGMNIGGGINWRVLGALAVYIEARYVYIASQSGKANNSNPYPPAYYSTNLIPITIGFRL